MEISCIVVPLRVASFEKALRELIPHKVQPICENAYSHLSLWHIVSSLKPFKPFLNSSQQHKVCEALLLIESVFIRFVDIMSVFQKSDLEIILNNQQRFGLNQTEPWNRGLTV